MLMFRIFLLGKNKKEAKRLCVVKSASRHISIMLRKRAKIIALRQQFHMSYSLLTFQEIQLLFVDSSKHCRIGCLLFSQALCVFPCWVLASIWVTVQFNELAYTWWFKATTIYVITFPNTWSLKGKKEGFSSAVVSLEASEANPFFSGF